MKAHTIRISEPLLDEARELAKRLKISLNRALLTALSAGAEVLHGSGSRTARLTISSHSRRGPRPSREDPREPES